MSVYTVHEPPLRAGAAAPDVERFAFVRDGFSWWAFLFAPLWMLRHRMWLVLIGYVVVAAAIEIPVRMSGAPAIAASKTAAASLEPPPNPACTGIRLSNRIRTGGSSSPSACIAATARLRSPARSSRSHSKLKRVLGSIVSSSARSIGTITLRMP